MDTARDIQRLNIDDRCFSELKIISFLHIFLVDVLAQAFLFHLILDVTSFASQ